MNGVWAKNVKGQKNVTLAFTLELEKKTECCLTLAAADCYKIYADGCFKAFGPQRAAHGYARKKSYHIAAKRIVIEVLSLQVQTFCWIKQNPFLACIVETADGQCYQAENFCCYQLTDRVQRVPRYSYMRGFCEIYRMQEDRENLYRGRKPINFTQLETELVRVPELLESRVDEPKYQVHTPDGFIERGAVTRDDNAPVWRDRSQTTVGREVEGFLLEECDEIPTDEASKFVCHPDEFSNSGGLHYMTYDFGRAITGFAELTVTVKEAGSVYLIFDELLWEEAGNGKNFVGFARNSCASVHKWTLAQPGVYQVSTFEPYTIRYACVIMSESVEVELSQRDYENPNVRKMEIPCEDERIIEIVRAAEATLAQNAVDILTDCPSRERGGYLSDSYFSSVAERIFTGKNQAEKAFLENYALSSSNGLPEGMLPMCYPADVYTNVGLFIPNWAMWYILELGKYAGIYGKDEIVEASRKKVLDVFDYFLKKENEYGVLENLEGWVFVEWSDANKSEHVKGVNVPTNILYAACLRAAATLYDQPEWRLKAERIHDFLKKYAYNGKFFVDNLIRNQDGKLVQTAYITEVCQYYAFWFNMVCKEEYPELYEELMERLGTNRREGYLPEVAKPNVMYGLYMRIDLLMRSGEREKVLEECIRLFSPMAKRTGTLWEHNNISASCNHGFAAYSIKWILYALTGENKEGHGL